MCVDQDPAVADGPETAGSLCSVSGEGRCGAGAGGGAGAGAAQEAWGASEC